MRKFYLLFVLTMVLSSCQFEDDNLILDPNFTLDGSSALTSNIKNLTQNSTTFDNFIDGTSKVRVELPFDIIINDAIEFRLEETIDYQNLIDVLEATPIEDAIDLVFPLNVSGIDHITTNVDSKNSFESLLQELPESSQINCLNINYPITIQYYSALSTQIANESVFNDAQLFNFLNNLINEGIFYEFEYPIEATTAEQNETLIYSNEEFATLYSDLPNFCIETAIYENNELLSNPDNPEEFSGFMTSGMFAINNFMIGNQGSIEFNTSSFTFNGNGQIFDNEINVGTWQVFLSNDVLILDLQFNDETYTSLENEWYIMALSETGFDLSYVDETGTISQLTMSIN